MENLVLNASSGEYSGEYQNENEVWQTRAYNLAINNIERLVKESKEVIKNYDNGAVNKTLPRIHDAMFIFGERGTGKTVFLYNLAKKWSGAKKNKGINTDVLFLDIIDPTLLIEQDNFVNVVIAHIHNCMQKKLDSDSHQKQSYYQILGQLAESLGQSEYDNREGGGLDRIISYQSSMDLEKNFHSYIELSIKILGVDAMVLPIDDVDMSLKKAHDVIETIRRLLSCPRLIPIVCGNEDIYNQLLKDYFRHSGQSSYQARQPLTEVSAKSLTTQYLRKVFPEQLRIGLISLDLLMPKITIFSNEHPDKVNAVEFFDNVTSLLCPLVNGKENSFTLERPETSRQFVQFVKKFYPYLTESEAVESTIRVQRNIEDFWLDFIHYSENTGNGQGYLTAHAEYLLHTPQVQFPSLLPLFNIAEQGEILISDKFKNFRKFEFFENSNGKSTIASSVRKVVSLSTRSTESDRWYISQERGLYEAFNGIGSTFIPMPKIEFYRNNLFISSDTLKHIKNKNLDMEQRKTASLLISLYTHSDYYGTSQYTSHQLFFGKAFEFFMMSVMGNFGGEMQVNNIFDALKAKPPMHSVHYFAPTKMYTSDDDNLEPSETNLIDSDLDFNAEEFLFLDEVLEWQNENIERLKTVRNKGLTHLFSFVFNKVFTQLHLMRSKNTFTSKHSKSLFDKDKDKDKDKEFSNDNLYHAAKRFEFLLLNAIGSFLKDNGAVAIQNTATTPNSDNLMNDRAKSLDRAYKLNVIDFVDGKETENSKLMQVFLSHPIFKLTNSYNPEQMRTWLYIGNRPQASTNEVEDKIELLNTFDNRLSEIKSKNYSKWLKELTYNDYTFDKKYKMLKQEIFERPGVVLNNLRWYQMETIFEKNIKAAISFLTDLLKANSTSLNVDSIEKIEEMINYLKGMQ